VEELMKAAYRNINLIQRKMKGKTAQVKWMKGLKKVGGVAKKLRRGS
jgi:hypothetical protein